MRWFVLLLALAACRDRPPVQEAYEIEDDPEWAADYVARVDAACACKDDVCVRHEHGRANAILEAEGGVEAAPPSVHEARTRLEACFVELSHDLARDLDVAADRICACESSYCATEYGEYVELLTQKYGAVSRSGLLDHAEATEASRAEYRRADECIAARTIPGGDYVAVLRASTEALCACKDQECSRRAIAALDDVTSKYFWVGADAAARAEIDELGPRYCECYTDALARGFDVKITDSITAFVTIDADCR